ncbi:MAG: GH32 C-terminal domain-containing protein [Muribaculaceae bacterium]|nr:GH32 C-terminal domain-containing protein [Muribaculaceae bacterium]
MKLKIKNLLAAPALLLALGLSAADGVKVEHLGINNTLVRVEGEGRYLLLPVQEAYDDAKVNIVVDGRLEKTIFVRLAKSKIDYKMPLDLSPWKGHDVVLNIVTTHDRTSVREAKQDACWSNLSLADTFDTANSEQYRPAFHHTPLYGWMNDPNGMFYKDGTWHLYYQWNPYGSKWQNMTWGHSSSNDLVHWDHHQAAIEPNGLGTVFSGSSAIDHENSAGFGEDAVVTLYTSAAESQIQSLAWSNDNGNTFNIYPGNPILTLESEARDPNMFWNPTTKEWTLVLAHALDREMLIFTSPDMKEWTLQSAFGKGLGAQEGVWECPDLFELTVDGTDKTKWVLLCNINPGGPFGGSGIQYFVGDFDGKTFKADTDASGKVATKWLDYGKDNYAVVSWSDAPESRRTLMGWMSNWQYAAEVPTHQFRSANTLPREISLFTAPDGQIYAATVPSPEIDALRGQLTINKESVSVAGKGKNFALPTANSGICEILLDIEPGKAETVSVTLSNDKDERAVLTYTPANDTLSFDRRNSGLSDFSQDFPAVTTAPTYTDGDKMSLRIFVDRSSIEVFADGGKSVMTNLVFPTAPYTALTLSTTGSQAKIKDLKVYALTPTVEL